MYEGLILADVCHNAPMRVKHIPNTIELYNYLWQDLYIYVEIDAGFIRAGVHTIITHDYNAEFTRQRIYIYL